MKQHMLKTLEEVRGFVKSVIRFGGSFGSPAAAESKLDEVRDWILGDTADIGEISRAEEENKKLKEENMALKKELDTILASLKKQQGFEEELLPSHVWCQKCYGFGILPDGMTCPKCLGRGRVPYKK